MRKLIEQIDEVMREGEASVAEGRKPYVPASYEARQAVQADLHEEVAQAARDALKAAVKLHQVLAKAADKTDAGTFLETRDRLWKLDVPLIMTKVAEDHTRWAKNIRGAPKGA